ncbi:transposon ty3-I gag-pol polyprotein, partial [Tanacetum coccineum]
LAKRTCPSVFSSRNNSLSIQSTSKAEGSQYGSKSVVLDKKKQPVNTSTMISKSTNQYDRPIVGKCFKCRLPGHRSSDCRETGRKVNLTLKEDEYDEEEENDEDNDGEEYDTNLFQPELGNDGEYTTQTCVIRRIMLSPKVNEPSQRHNLFRIRCVVHQKIFDAIIDSGSTENIISRDIYNTPIFDI